MRASPSMKRCDLPWRSDPLMPRVLRTGAPVVLFIAIAQIDEPRPDGGGEFAFQ